MIDAMAAATAATADIAEIIVFQIKRLLSVRSFDAGVSTIWFIVSTPGM